MFLSRTSQSGHRSSLQSNESSILKSSLKSSLKASPRSPAIKSPTVKAAAVASATTVVYQKQPSKQTSKQSPISKTKKKAPKPVAVGVTNVAYDSTDENSDAIDDDVFVPPKPRLTIPSLIEEETSLRSSNRTTNPRNTQNEDAMMTSKVVDDVTRETLEEIHEVGNDDVFETKQEIKTLFGIKPGSTIPGPISSGDLSGNAAMMTSLHQYPTSVQHNRTTEYNNPTSGYQHPTSDATSGSEITRKPSIHGIKLPSIQNEVPQVAIKAGLLLGSSTKEGLQESKTDIEGLHEFQQQLKNGDLPKIEDFQEDLPVKEGVQKKSETKPKKKKRKKPLPEDNSEDLQNGLEGHRHEQPSSLESTKSRQSLQNNEDQVKSSRKKKIRKSQKASSDLQATSSAASISPEDQQRLEDIYNRALEEQNFEKPSEGTI